MPAPDPGPRPELTWLPVDRLDVDPAYQRSIDTARSRNLIARIAAGFRWAAFQAILASPSAAAAERWLIIDGQHRVMAARQIGLSLVPAVVIHAADRQDQARAFIGANRDRVPVSAPALFHARLAAGDSDALALQRLVERAGIEITRYSVGAAHAPAGKTPAVSALQRLVRELGEARAGAAIAAVAHCYARDKGALRAAFFLAAGEYLRDGGSEDELRRALTMVGWRGLEAAAFGLGGRTAPADLANKLRAAIYPARAGGEATPRAPVEPPKPPPRKIATAPARKGGPLPAAKPAPKADERADIERFLAERGATRLPGVGDPGLREAGELVWDRKAGKWIRRAAAKGAV